MFDLISYACLMFRSEIQGLIEMQIPTINCRIDHCPSLLRDFSLKTLTRLPIKKIHNCMYYLIPKFMWKTSNFNYTLNRIKNKSMSSLHYPILLRRIGNTHLPFYSFLTSIFFRVFLYHRHHRLEWCISGFLSNVIMYFN